MMPLTGLMTGMFDARKLLAVGLTVGGGTLLWLAGLNLQAGYWDVFWPQLIQGVGMSLLFVPLTTVSMDSIPRERMGNATSLFNLMRNIGGSVGIAITGTLLARHSQATTSTLGSHVTMYDQASQSMFAQLRAGFMAAGADGVTATNRAYAALFGMPATSLDGGVRRVVSVTRPDVPRPASARADHAEAQRRRTRQRSALRLRLQTSGSRRGRRARFFRLKPGA
jgi:MFS family permease